MPDLEALFSVVSHLDTTKASQSDIDELSIAVAALSVTTANQMQLNHLATNLSRLSSSVTELDAELQALQDTAATKAYVNTLDTKIGLFEAEKVDKEKFNDFSATVSIHISTSQSYFDSINSQLSDLSSDTHTHDGSTKEYGTNTLVVLSSFSLVVMFTCIL